MWWISVPTWCVMAVLLCPAWKTAADRCEMCQNRAKAACTTANLQHSSEITVIVQHLQQHYSLYWCVHVSSYLWRSPAGREPSPPPSSRPTASACSPFSFFFIKESRKGADPALDDTPDSAERHRVRVGERGRGICSSSPLWGCGRERERESVGGVSFGWGMGLGEVQSSSTGRPNKTFIWTLNLWLTVKLQPWVLLKSIKIMSGESGGVSLPIKQLCSFIAATVNY